MNQITRRPVLLGILGLAGAGLAAWQVPRWLRFRISTPYDDVTESIDDHAAALIVGEAVLIEDKTFSAEAVARDLRARKATVPMMAKADIAHVALREVSGWLMPQSLALACALLANQAPVISDAAGKD